MCGILTIAGKAVELYPEDTLDSMLETLSRRGPDDRGVLRFPGCILGQTRLSILDIGGGHQPMRDSTYDSAITFNGEIYNHVELRKVLQDKGHRFTTNSDTEVILKAYQEYGDDCPKHLEGMFAFVIWDNAKKRLFMARDRFGEKPLFYTVDQHGSFVAASEIKALFAAGSVLGEMDYDAIDAYFHLLYIPPQKTVFKNILPLPPAHYGVYDGGELKIERYWSLPNAPLRISEPEAMHGLKELLNLSVQRCMVADVEVGTFLSGGVDSSIVTHLAQSHSKGRVKSFSAGFEEYINELPYARQAANIVGTDHREIQMKSDIASVLQKVCASFDEPFADSSSIPQFLISEFARKEVKVVLSGDGGDEMFIGYGWYWKQFNLGLAEKVKRNLRRDVRHMFADDPLRDHVNYLAHMNKLERLLLWRDTSFANSAFPIHFEGSEFLPPIERINMFDLHMFLPGDILPKVDRASMMASLEVRSPFLDRRLAEFAWSLPMEYKTDRRNGKLILKKAYTDVFGHEFLHRRKQGFSAPVQHWLLRDDIRSLVYASFMEKEAGVYAFLQEWYIKSMIRRFYEKKDLYHGYRLWILLCLELWLDAHKQYIRI